MTIFLPGEKNGLPAFEARFDRACLDRWTATLRIREVAVTVPIFRMECKPEATRALKDLGMASAFDAGQANFSDMAKSRVSPCSSPKLFTRRSYRWQRKAPKRRPPRRWRWARAAQRQPKGRPNFAPTGPSLF